MGSEYNKYIGTKNVYSNHKQYSSVQLLKFTKSINARAGEEQYNKATVRNVSNPNNIFYLGRLERIISKIAFKVNYRIISVSTLFRDKNTCLIEVAIRIIQIT